MAYEGAARAAIVTLKFRSGRYLAPLMGEFMCAHLAARPLEADVIVPVPLTPRRLRERGFNQAAILAEQVAAGLGLRVMNDALRREDRPSQRTLSAAERADNLRGAFTSVVDQRESIGGKRVLIVDDVVTTGATVSACADTLAEAGARQILALAFARDL
jgi:ComF family protein